MKTQTATLLDDSTIDYFPTPIGEGGMKLVYLTADKKSVVCFYKDQNEGKDPNRMKRLKEILGKYNPTTSAKNGDYFKDLFCWPTAIVKEPQIGVVTPLYPISFFFKEGIAEDKEKESTWFVRPKLRKLLPESEKGNWINYFSASIMLARAVRRLHLAGLAHSDLSNANVLLDPTVGKCLIIDIDSLVVPGLYPPDVVGTRHYIAPEVLATLHLSITDSNRQHPCNATDQHALAVLIYQYLLSRHPLDGPKTYPASTAEEQERLEMGEKALFIEHPQDSSNRPKDLKVPYTSLGPALSELFERAFIQGLHSPADRPTALEWEKALIKTWDMLIPCHNTQCPSQWFVLQKHHSQCPFCGTKPKGPIPYLTLRSERKPGNWMRDGQLAVYSNKYLYKWHVLEGIFPGEAADKTPQAYFVFHNNKWLLINQNLLSLVSPGGHKVAPSPKSDQPGQAIELTEGRQFYLDKDDPNGRLIEVEMINP